MKKLALVLISSVLFSFSSAFANPSEWLTCKTTGDALVSFDLAQNNAGRPESMLVLGQLIYKDATYTGSTEFKPSTFDKMSKTGIYSLTLKTADSKIAVGAVSDAIYVVLAKNSRSGNFVGKVVAKGTVYSVKCMPSVQ